MTTTSMATLWTEQAPHKTALEAAQRLQWSVFPLEQDKNPPRTGGTHPDGTPKRLRWKPWQSRRATAEDILHWQQQYTPDAWAVITGTISGLLILDFDHPEGEKTREQLGLIPHVRTGSGGSHVYFRHPGWPIPTLNHKTKPALGKRWPGLDVRADGGYAAFCGHNTSGPYSWVREPTLEDITILPEELCAFLGLLHPPSISTSQQKGETQRHDALGVPTDLGEVLLQRALRKAQEPGAGRNNIGFWLACQLRDNGVTPQSAKVLLCTYAQQVPQTNSKGLAEPYTVQEALASMASAYAEQAREAWDITPTLTAGQHSGNGSSITTAGTATLEPPVLPEIILGGDQLRDLTDQAIAAIMQQERRIPSLFLQSARLVRVGRTETHRPLVAQMGIVEVKEVLTHTANYFKLKKVPGAESTYEKYPVSPPKELAEQVLARQTQVPYLPFPALEAIVETPVIRPDGTILDTPGYDEKTRLYYAPQEGMKSCKVPMQPTRKEREAALAWIWEAIGEFPYVEEADKANALGLLLTPIVRQAIRRHVPLALIDAPKQGTGKGLLSDVTSIIATGQSAPILTLSDSEEELQKSITSLLIEGATMITIDNITGRLQSKHLDAALTSDLWRGRILGQSKMTLIPQRATWVATGNNIKLGGDLARRCYRIRLDPKVSKPWMRAGFKHSDLAGWVADHRAELVSALLTLARAWFAAECPQYEHIPALGTFTGWTKMVGGILEYAGVQGFLSNLDKLYDESDDEGIEWETFLRGWHEQFGSTWVTTSDVIAAMTSPENEEMFAGSGDESAGSAFAEMLPGTLQIAFKEKPKSFRIRFGKALEKRTDTCYGQENFHIERGGVDRKGVGLWRVCAGSAGSSSSHAYDEILSTITDANNKYRDGRGNSQHSLHAATPLIDQSRLASASSTYISQQIPEDQLPATSETEEVFEL